MADISQIEMPNGSEYNLKDTIARKHLSYFGTCATAAATAAKVVTVDEDSFELQPGVIIGVHFTNSNTADDVTLNVNNTGAKEIYYNNAVYDGHSTGITGYAKRTIFYMYDGTYWVFLSQAVVDSNTDTKVRQTLVSGDANRPLLMAYSANTVTTTNVDNVSYRNNSIYANPSTGTVTATNFDGKINNHTVNADVPSGAVFTDTQANWTQTTTTALDYIKNKPTLGTAAAKDVPSSGNASTTQVVMGNDTRLSNARTPTSHSHGNLQNDGNLQVDDVTPAANDRIVITDKSNGGLITRSDITFDATTTTKFLSQKGTWQNGAVPITATSGNDYYPVTFGVTADATTPETSNEGIRKDGNENSFTFQRHLSYNPSNGNLKANSFNGIRIGSINKVQSGKDITFIIPKDQAKDMALTGIVFGRQSVACFNINFSSDASTVAAAKVSTLNSSNNGTVSQSYSLGSNADVGAAWFYVLTFPETYNLFSYMITCYSTKGKLRQIVPAVIVNNTVYYEKDNQTF